MLTITMRRATPDDVAAVACHVHALLDELSDGQAPTLDAVTATARNVLASDRVIALLAEQDGTAIGLLTLNECMAIYAGGLFGEICELHVSAAQRSRGIASCLLSAALDEARARGWSRLEVGAPAQPAWSRTLSFYRTNGFVETGPRLRRTVDGS